MMLNPLVSTNWRVRAATFFVAFGLLGWGSFALPAQAQGLQAIPPLTAHVMDTTGTLDSAQLQALEARLAAFEKSQGAQVVVLMVPTTLPEEITDYTQRVGDAWKIGRKGIGDGVLLVVAQNDRRIRIAVAKALEGAIPDLAAKQIIDMAITPQFKQGNFVGGLNAGADQLMSRISGENLPLPADGNGSNNPKKRGFQWTDLAVFLFFAVPIGARLLSGILGRKVGAFATGGAVGVLAWLFTSSLLIAGGVAVAGLVFALFASLASFGGFARNSGFPGLGGSSGSGGWSSGGGFSSGGGGDFGGGGSSGSW